MDQFAENYAKKGLVHLREIFTPGTLQVPKTHSALKELESIHKVGNFLFLTVMCVKISCEEFSWPLV